MRVKVSRRIAILSVICIAVFVLLLVAVMKREHIRLAWLEHRLKTAGNDLGRLDLVQEILRVRQELNLLGEITTANVERKLALVPGSGVPQPLGSPWPIKQIDDYHAGIDRVAFSFPDAKRVLWLDFDKRSQSLRSWCVLTPIEIQSEKDVRSMKALPY